VKHPDKKHVAFADLVGLPDPLKAPFVGVGPALRRLAGQGPACSVPSVPKAEKSEKRGIEQPEIFSK
jgi:hypothetical protein